MSEHNAKYTLHKPITRKTDHICHNRSCLVLEDRSLTPSARCFSPIVVLDLFLTLPRVKESEASNAFFKCDLLEAKRLDEVCLILCFRAVV